MNTEETNQIINEVEELDKQQQQKELEEKASLDEENIPNVLMTQEEIDTLTEWIKDGKTLKDIAVLLHREIIEPEPNTENNTSTDSVDVISQTKKPKGYKPRKGEPGYKTKSMMIAERKTKTIQSPPLQEQFPSPPVFDVQKNYGPEPVIAKTLGEMVEVSIEYKLDENKKISLSLSEYLDGRTYLDAHEQIYLKLLNSLDRLADLSK